MSNPKKSISVILGSVFWIGFLKPGPGTWGSLAALPLIWYGALWWGWTALAIILILFSLITILAAPVYEKHYGEDPSSMVSDEVAGQALPFLLLILTGYSIELWSLIAGFVFFRIFDITKILGIDSLQKYHGGWGILMDDVLAGLYAYFCLKIVILTIL